ncbi:hypothetical protein EOK75_05245 [Pseudorhodobacter turbinis]|uniref:Uncharacterized protein n=1 Tax=Pseudorhodobacter turbinis TaxID=2500533 RepID=A0A4P8EDZ3_9RHOB|nr:hypothetical protein [Pseudorhodobacter turbinis]QCO55231.1 hypothetical protein EOK75_05245 [Pseudorhodobacter turbinis]
MHASISGWVKKWVAGREKKHPPPSRHGDLMCYNITLKIPKNQYLGWVKTGSKNENESPVVQDSARPDTTFYHLIKIFWGGIENQTGVVRFRLGPR